MTESKQTLREAGVVAGGEWATVRSAFISRFQEGKRLYPLVDTVSELMNSTVLPPALAHPSPSGRNHYQESYHPSFYPPTLEEWTAFADIVSSFNPPNGADRLNNVIDVLSLCTSSVYEREVMNEMQEQYSTF